LTPSQSKGRFPAQKKSQGSELCTVRRQRKKKEKKKEKEKEKEKGNLEGVVNEWVRCCDGKLANEEEGHNPDRLGGRAPEVEQQLEEALADLVDGREVANTTVELLQDETNHAGVGDLVQEEQRAGEERFHKGHHLPPLRGGAWQVPKQRQPEK